MALDTLWQMTDSIEVSHYVPTRGYTESNMEHYFRIPHKRLRVECFTFLPLPLSRGVRDKPLELTSIAGGSATNSSNRAFGHPFGSAATVERLRVGHFTLSHMG
jgi:hypothetical protein